MPGTGSLITMWAVIALTAVVRRLCVASAVGLGWAFFAERGVVMRRLALVLVVFGAALVLSACSGKTTGATNVTDASATLTSTG